MGLLTNLLVIILCISVASAFVPGTKLCLSGDVNGRWAPCLFPSFFCTFSLSSAIGGDRAGTWTSGSQVTAIDSNVIRQCCLGSCYNWVYVSVAGGGKVWMATEAGVAPCGGGDVSGSLQDVVNRLVNEAPSRAPGTQAAISVINLNTGESASANGDVLHVSASSAKVMWVAAAVNVVGTSRVQPLAGPIFINSDNTASGTCIDLVGANGVNNFYWNVVGMRNSAFTSWGASRQASNSPRRMGGDNYFTANDCALFLRKLAQNQILGNNANTVKQWMTMAPKSGTGGWLGTKLPAQAKNSLMHKGGFVPAFFYLLFKSNLL